jgi:hypothetical protein
MSLTFLYGSTVWIVTTVASAQLAFPGAMEQAADLAKPIPAASSEHVASRNCPHCIRGDCIMCGQSAFRMDYEGCGSYGGAGFAGPDYSAAASDVVAVNDPAPKATEPDAPAAVATVERAGMLSAISVAVERAPGAEFVRETLSSGVQEASRALAVARRWLAERPKVSTAPLPPNYTQAEGASRLREWFGVGFSPEIAANLPGECVTGDETPAQPAVTRSAEASLYNDVSVNPVADIDSLVPQEAFGPPSTVTTSDAEAFVDWEAEIAREYRQSQADPRQDVLSPTIRTAAVALERLGYFALELSGRLRSAARLTDYH